jgi:hypothetical protein
MFTCSAIGVADPAFVGSVKGGGKLSPAEAVEVYRAGYPARISEALGETFEACWRMLGDEAFLEACRVYARSTPSISPNLSDYGSSFPDFLLKRFKKEAPFIGDLARLEWGFKELFHAKAHAGLAPVNLSVAVKKDSVLIFGSAMSLLSFKHSVHGLWKRDRSNNTPLSRSDWTGREEVLLYKSGGTPVFSRVLAAPGASALRSLLAGNPLAESLANAKGLTEASARELFSFISDAGLITEVR